MTIELSNDLGGLHAHYLPTVGQLFIGLDVRLDRQPPCTSAVVVVFAAGARLRDFDAEVSPRTSDTSISARYGDGAAVAAFAEPGSRGPAANVANVGAGVSSVSTRAGDAIVGAFTLCDACLGQWTGPDGRPSEWHALTLAPPRFAGAAGPWTFDIQGVTYARGWASRPAFAAWAPIGAAAAHFG